MMKEFLGTDINLDNCTSYFIEDELLTDDQKEQFHEFCYKKNFYDYAKILPDAIEVLEKLNDVYDIYICSAATIDFDKFKEQSGKYHMDKYNFLIKNLPFLDVKKFIFTNSKNIISADIQIDDRLNNLQNNNNLKILFESYHNKKYTKGELEKNNVVRVCTWKGIEKMLLN